MMDRDAVESAFHVILKNPDLISFDMMSADDLSYMIYGAMHTDPLDFEIRKAFIIEVMSHGPNLMIGSDEDIPMIYDLFKSGYMDIFNNIPDGEKCRIIAFCKKSHLLFLNQSIMMNRFDIADILFSSGFNSKADASDYYRMPLMEIKYTIEYFEDWLKYFYKHGFNLNEFFKTNPAIVGRNIFNLFYDDINKYDKLLEYGLDIELRNASGNTLAHDLTQVSNPKYIQRLIDRGCDINAINNEGDTPIMYALSDNSSLCTKTIETLLAHNPKLDVKNKKGQDVLDIISCTSSYAARRVKILNMILDKYPHVDLNRGYVNPNKFYDRSLYNELLSTFGSYRTGYPYLISYK